MAEGSLVIRREAPPAAEDAKARPAAKAPKPKPKSKPEPKPESKPSAGPSAAKSAVKAPATKDTGTPPSTLELATPAPRGYRPRSTGPRAARDFTRVTSSLMWLGGLVTLALLGYVLVFTSPDRTENVLAFVALSGFGAFFFAWAIGAWLRTGDEASAPRPPAVTVTRQAVLVAVGALAVATAAVNSVATPAAVILIVLVVISAELLIRRMPIGR
ncbi:MAG: hypothetical protein OXG43_06915 [Chloroflexi bacterium]|nr:hypothetical protein [Chloroflexota bacterium]